MAATISASLPTPTELTPINRSQPSDKDSTTTSKTAGGVAHPANAAVLQDMIEGNKRFVEGTLKTLKADHELVVKLAEGQHPKAIVLACSDSRCPPELVFDQGLGDLFIVRVAGNLVGKHEMGSILYAAGNLHVKLIMVLGHSKCGAIGASVDVYNKELGKPTIDETDDPISSLVAEIYPVVHLCRNRERSSGDDAVFKHEVAKQNSRRAAQEVAESLAARLPAEEHKYMNVVAAIYNVEHGGVDILETLSVGAEKSDK